MGWAEFYAMLTDGDEGELPTGAQCDRLRAGTRREEEAAEKGEVDAVLRIMRVCLQRSPERRPTAEELVRQCKNDGAYGE